MTRSGIIGLLAGFIVVLGLATAAVLPRLTASSAPTIGGPFALTGADGRTVTDRDFRGKWMVIYFGYTHCPDACPTTLSDIGAALDKLPAPNRQKFAVLFITVDPQRDTPRIVSDYAHAFGPEFTGLTGSPSALAPVERSFRVYAQRHELKGGDYAMDHSSVIYVMAPDGAFVGIIDDSLKPADIAKRLQQFGA
jgi:protein SCO1/2